MVSGYTGRRALEHTDLGLNPSSAIYRQRDLCNCFWPQFSSSVKRTIIPMLWL